MAISALRSAAAAGDRDAGPDRRLRIDARELQRRREPEDQAAHHAERRGERQR